MTEKKRTVETGLNTPWIELQTLAVSDDDTI